MVITAIERQKRRPERVNIFVDGEFALGVHESVLLTSGYRKGDTVDEAAFRALLASEDFNAAKEKALRLISYRLRSEQELRKRLANKDFSTDVIDRVMENLRQSRLIDDLQFSLALVHDLILRKNAGAGLLRRELKAKGIPPEIMNTVLDQILPAEEEERALNAASIALKRYASSRKQSDRLKQRQRIVSLLARRGFDFSIINRVTRKLFAASGSPGEITDEEN